jgi:hypothetical protein
MCAISPWVTLAAADDLDGVQDNTRSFDVTGAQRVIVNSRIATDGTAGIDVFCVSHDGGVNWTPDSTTGLLMSADDATGTLLVAGALNAAGVEALVAGGASTYKFGPYEGPTAVRILRKTGDFGAGAITWVTGAPEVLMATVGLRNTAPVAVP